MKTEQEIRAKIEELEKTLAEVEEGYDEDIEMAEDEDNIEEAEGIEQEKEIKTEKIEEQIGILKWVLNEK